jgi:hypothetical protein
MGVSPLVQVCERHPRVRGLAQRFQSQLLPLFGKELR